MATMLARPRSVAATGNIWCCSCRWCRGHGKGQKMHRRTTKRRERRQWKREVGRAA